MKDILIDFGLPVLILIMLFVLMVTGIDSEVKTVFVATIGWLLNSGVSKVRQIRRK